MVNDQLRQIASLQSQVELLTKIQNQAINCLRWYIGRHRGHNPEECKWRMAVQRWLEEDWRDMLDQLEALRREQEG